MTVTKRKSKPTTAHPMFPFVTALWFATFFGLGSFAIAPALLEGPVVALGIPALVPAAAPPLGFTARLMFALAMLGLGGVSGYIVGRALGRGKVDAPVRSRGVGKVAKTDGGFEARRPINPTEDLGAPLDTPIEQDVPLRRRALSLHDESEVSIPFESAPLPGPMPWEIAAHHAEVTDDSFVASEPAVVLAEADATQADPADPLALDLLLEEAQIFGQSPSDPFVASEAFAQSQVFESSPPKDYADHETVVAPPPLGLDLRRFVAEEPMQVAPPTPMEPSFAAPIHQAQPVAAGPIEHAALESLGLVQLIERLALAISRRTRRPEPSAAMTATETAPAPCPAPEPRDIPRFVASPQAEPDPAAPAAFAAPERVVQLRPAKSQQVAPQEFDASFGDEAGDVEEDDLGLDRFLRISPLQTRKPAREPDESAPADLAPEPEVAEECYPSLLDIGPVAARREPLRIDDGIGDEPDDEAAIEPVVVFPGQQQTPLTGQARQFERPSITPLPGSPLAAPGRAAPSPPTADVDDAAVAGQPSAALDAEEADRALRAALATLQRMTAQG